MCVQILMALARVSDAISRQHMPRPGRRIHAVPKHVEAHRPGGALRAAHSLMYREHAAGGLD